MAAYINPQKSENMFLQPLEEQIDLKHPLAKLTRQIDWQSIDDRFNQHFCSRYGRPATSPRVIAGLLYLQHAFNLSDEQVVYRWLENVYWQYFTGEQYLQLKLPIDPSSLTRWRNRLGEEGLEFLLSQTIEVATKIKAVKPSSLSTVIVDTTVQPKAVAYPTDSRLHNKARVKLVKLAKKHGIRLRQNYNKQAKDLLFLIGRYAHAKQFRRMNKQVKILKGRVGRVCRDIERKMIDLSQQAKQEIQLAIDLTNRLLAQNKKDKNKLYSVHAPEVECIAKGKARTPYEFGVKVSLTTTVKEGFVLGARSMPGNPYDGHTLYEALEQASILSNSKIKTAIVDRGYRGEKIDGVQILMSGQKRGITKRLKALINRRSCIEGTIGHMKNDGKLGRNWLKGSLGDAYNAILCGAGHNIRLLLRLLRLFYTQISWLKLFAHNCQLQKSAINN